MGAPFRRHAGMSVMDYVNDLRIDRARAMLRSTQYRVHEISETLGYNTPYDFARRFRAATGMTPTEYRRKTREER